MKKPRTNIERMIMESHYLNALEIESSANQPLCGMERQDYIDQIKTLSDTISQFKDMISSLKSVHESDLAEKAKFQELIMTLTKEVFSLRQELSKQNDRKARHNKHSFGKGSLKSTVRPDDKPSREEEK